MITTKLKHITCQNGDKLQIKINDRNLDALGLGFMYLHPKNYLLVVYKDRVFLLNFLTKNTNANIILILCISLTLTKSFISLKLNFLAKYL